MANQLTYILKERPYRILHQAKMKDETTGDWIPCIIYMTLYDNPDGTIWVRSVKEFYLKFKSADNVINKVNLDMELNNQADGDTNHQRKEN